MKTQIGTASSADFEEGTWTFDMPTNFRVCAGKFAIIPEKQYNEALNNIETMVYNFPKNAEFMHMKDVLESIIKNISHEKP